MSDNEEEIILSHGIYMSENGIKESDLTADQTAQLVLIREAITAYETEPSDEAESALIAASDKLTDMLKEPKKPDEPAPTPEPKPDPTPDPTPDPIPDPVPDPVPAPTPDPAPQVQASEEETPRNPFEIPGISADF